MPTDTGGPPELARAVSTPWITARRTPTLADVTLCNDGGASSTVAETLTEATVNELARGAYARRAEPLNRPLPATLKWMASLPAPVQPVVLLEQFPRIANRLAQCWHDPAALSEYFNDLLVDRRGGRRGFPPTVRRELSTLSEYIAYQLFRR